MEKRIRFGDLVRSAGRPQTLAMWTAPQENRALSQAIRQNRVVTVVQEPTSKRKEFGLIGFHEKPHSTYLLFPRPLPHREGRIIGLNFELIEEQSVSEPAKGGKKAPTKPAKPKPDPKEFTFCIRHTATIEESVTIMALALEKAKQEAMKSVKHQRFDVSKAVMREEIVSTS